MKLTTHLTGWESKGTIYKLVSFKKSDQQLPVYYIYTYILNEIALIQILKTLHLIIWLSLYMLLYNYVKFSICLYK